MSTTTAIQQTALRDQILDFAQQQPEGYPLCEETLGHLAGRAELFDTLDQLAEEDEVTHFRGEEAYFLNATSLVLGKCPPGAYQMVEQLAILREETLVVNGCAAANSMRLTDQRTVKIMFLTSGESRTSKMGNLEVIYRKAEPWELLFTDNKPGYADQTCGTALRAISFQSLYHGEKTAKRVKAQLTHEEWESILAVIGQLPSEVRESIENT